MDELKDKLPGLLVVCGIGLQFVRAMPAFNRAGRELTYVGAAVVVCSLAYVLTQTFVGGVRREIVEWLLWLPGALQSVAGATLGTSILSTFAAKIPGVSTEHPLVPVTNTK